jgi:hypothetical protein
VFTFLSHCFLSIVLMGTTTQPFTFDESTHAFNLSLTFRVSAVHDVIPIVKSLRHSFIDYAAVLSHPSLLDNCLPDVDDCCSLAMAEWLRQQEQQVRSPYRKQTNV